MDTLSETVVQNHELMRTGSKEQCVVARDLCGRAPQFTISSLSRLLAHSTCHSLLHEDKERWFSTHCVTSGDFAWLVAVPSKFSNFVVDVSADILDAQFTYGLSIELSIRCFHFGHGPRVQNDGIAHYVLSSLIGVVNAAGGMRGRALRSVLAWPPALAALTSKLGRHKLQSTGICLRRSVGANSFRHLAQENISITTLRLRWVNSVLQVDGERGSAESSNDSKAEHDFQVLLITTTR